MNAQIQDRVSTSGLSRAWENFSRRLDRAAISIDHRPAALFIFFLCDFFLGVVKTERIKPLWHDELYTFYISQAHSLRTMMTWIRTIDLNPPMYYLAARLTFHFLHPSPFSVRLPAMAGYLTATLCLYQFVRRRLSPLYGMLGGLVLLGSYFAPYSFEARPYALMLGFLGLVALGWQRAIEEPRYRRTLALCLIVIGGTGLLLSHVLASVAYAALLLTEFIRTSLRRRIDWVLWVCLLVPLSACVTYLQPVAHHASGAFPPDFQASVYQLFDAYGDLWVGIAAMLCAGMILVVLLEAGAPAQRPTTSSGFSAPELLLAVGLCCVPLVVVLVFMHSHSAYFPRYGIASAFGAGILVPWVIARWTATSCRAALACSLFFLFGIVTPATIARHLQALFPISAPTGARTGISTTPFSDVDPNLPFVDASGLTFLEMNSRENPAFLSRVYYLTDARAAVHYANATIFEGMPNLVGKFPIQGHVEPYPDFIRKHRQFLVFGTYNYPEDWLLRKLLADGATLKFIGDYPSTYKDDHLYEVTMAH